jgi:predicted nuclease of predicted toxin-antitoxin system
LISSDKDFGNKVFREQRPHQGVILLRLENEQSANKIALYPGITIEIDNLDSQ